MIYETEIDSTFPHSQFLTEHFSTPYRLDRDSNGSRIFLYVSQDIPSHLIATEKKLTEILFVGLTFVRNDKWLRNCLYNPHKNLIGNHLDTLSRILDLFSST